MRLGMTQGDVHGGHVPLVRAFFRSDEDWKAAATIIRERVAAAGVKGTTQVRTVLSWLLFLLVAFLAWHFAQLPNP